MRLDSVVPKVGSHMAPVQSFRALMLFGSRPDRWLGRSTHTALDMIAQRLGNSRKAFVHVPFVRQEEM